MANKKSNNQKKENMNNFKEEIASELGINLDKENLTAKEAGTVGGEMVRRMVKSYEKENDKIS